MPRLDPKVQLGIAAVLMAISSSLTALTTTFIHPIPTTTQAEFLDFKDKVMSKINEQGSKLDVVAVQVQNIKETVTELKARN